jgi:hypothetical protein
MVALKILDLFPETEVATYLDPINNLIALYETWNKPEKAKEWRAKLPQTEAVEE